MLLQKESSTAIIVLDGNGCTITGTDAGSGILNNEYDGVVIKNFAGINSFIYGIYSVGTTNSVINNNYISSTRPYGDWVGIVAAMDEFAVTSDNNLIYENTITNLAPGAGSNTGFLIRGNTNQLFNNEVNLSGYGVGLYLRGTSNQIHDNTITVSNSGLEEGRGITLNGGYAGETNNNLFLNNDLFLTTESSYLLVDSTYWSDVNQLNYANSWGTIDWIDDEPLGFLRNLGTKMTNGLGLNTANIHIGSNVAAFNTAAVTAGNINSDARITLNGLTPGSITSIYKYSGYSTDPAYIKANGANCLGTTCTLVSYSGGTLIFDTTSLGSFTAE